MLSLYTLLRKCSNLIIRLVIFLPQLFLLFMFYSYLVHLSLILRREWMSYRCPLDILHDNVYNLCFVSLDGCYLSRQVEPTNLSPVIFMLYLDFSINVLQGASILNQLFFHCTLSLQGEWKARIHYITMTNESASSISNFLIIILGLVCIDSLA